MEINFKENGDTWTWAGNAASTMMPKAVEFYKKVDADLYSYLSEAARKKAFQRKRIDWEGANEVINAKHKLNDTNIHSRKTLFESVRQSFIKGKRNDGYKIIEINI